MATLRTRLERLEGQRGGAEHAPDVIIRNDAETGEPVAVWARDMGRRIREPGETVEAFTARAQP